MADLLRRVHASNLQVFVVWEPMLPTDWARPTTGVLGRMPDARVEQFWDPHHLISHTLEPTLPKGEPGCCRRNGAYWDDVALFPPGARFGSASPSMIEGPVVDSVGDLSAQLKTESGKTLKVAASNLTSEERNGSHLAAMATIRKKVSSFE